MAFARHWDQIRVGAQLNILFGLALLVSIVTFAPHFDFGRVTTWAYAIGILLLTLAMIVLYWRQERARPAE
jgi:protein-S-isoprenylcysteine O-methyltransferase Ste14